VLCGRKVRQSGQHWAKEESLDGWKIKRNIDGVDKADFSFPAGTILRGGEKLKIWAKDSRPPGATADLEYTDNTWGVGSHVTTKLVNPQSEDRATHVQKTNYT